ncbi:MAG TPA: efflux transporter outer membrane subunit, partial [Steroidobacteraceae bacterium]
AGLLLGGCITPPPKASAPALPQSAPIDATDPELAGTWPERQWWLRYGDATLNALIERALQDSPDVAAAGARFEAAGAAAKQVAASAGPQVSADADAERQRLSDNGLLPPRLLGFNWYNTIDLGLKASYSFDWWGLHRDQLRSAVDSQRALAAERDAAALALAVSVASEYFAWQADHARQELAAERVVLADREVAIVGARVNAQIARIDELQQAKQALYATQDHAVETATAEQIDRIALAALLGCSPAQLPSLTARPLPQLPVVLPANASIDLIARRPDIAASRWRIEAATEDRLAARAGFMPDVSLNALLGLSSIQFSRLLEYGSRAPAFGAAIHLPIFDAGALRAGYRRSQANLAAAVDDYRAVLIGAAKEVNTQLETRATQSKELALRADQLNAAEQLQQAAAQRLAGGLSDARPEIDSQIQVLTAREAQLQSAYLELSADLALIHALGGGYSTEPKS